MRSFPLLLVMLLSLPLLAYKPAADAGSAAEVKPVAAAPTPACVLRAGFDAWEPYHYLGQGLQPKPTGVGSVSYAEQKQCWRAATAAN